MVVGAGGTEFENWISTDHPVVNLLNHTRLGAVFGTGELSAILAEHVFEHFTLSQAVLAFQGAWCLLSEGEGFVLPYRMRTTPVSILRTLCMELGPKENNRMATRGIKPADNRAAFPHTSSMRFSSKAIGVVG